MNEFELLDWKRRIFELYAEVRAWPRAEAAWQHWRDVRDELFRNHPQSPLGADLRGSFTGLRYFPYDPRLRLIADVEPTDAEWRDIAGSGGSTTRFRRFGLARFQLDGTPHSLELYWLEGYGGGVFLPFVDATSETYPGGRYLLDTVKGAELGGAGEGQIVVDFNFAYNPSCSYDARWVCPLTPHANYLGVEIRAGELHSFV
jgi:uncharacterized protein (DUF1684 family)